MGWSNVQRARKRRECIHSVTASRQRDDAPFALGWIREPVKPSRLGARLTFRSDPITILEVWWRRRRLMTTSSISFSIDHRSSWETSPWQGRWTEPQTVPNRTTSVLFSIRLCSRTSHAKSRGMATAVSNSCMCKVHSQTTRLGPLANCVPLAVTPLQSPCVVQRHTSHPCFSSSSLLKIMWDHCHLANFSLAYTPRPRQRAPRLQAMTSLSVVIPNNSAPLAVATGTPDVVVRRGIGCADSDSCTYTW